MEVSSPPAVSTVTLVQDDEDEQLEEDEEHVAYLRSELVSSVYEMCIASLESMAREVCLPTSPVESIVVFTQEPPKLVA